MKSLIACLVAVFALGGCIAVPYAAAPDPGGYYPGGYYYGPPVPAATINFGYTYRGGGYGYGPGGYGPGRRYRH